ncbi:MAG: amino acid ABC transporter permease [Propionibacteriaceae bacterium]|jgi:polar amino acid transport system permease protein|nr:amino acid ABC transporter permease [Propionibacteriaceae bacterium]
MDVNTLLDYLPLFAQAAVLTIGIAAMGVACSLVIGLLGAIYLYFRTPVLRQFFAVYIEVSRNTPLVVQLFFLYYALPKLGLVLSSAVCAITGLAFLGGGYMAEAWRSGLEAVPPLQFRSALSLGFKPIAALRHVALPQAMARAAPALTANTVFLIKETSVVSVVALPDLVFVAKDLIGASYNTSEALTLLVLFYLLILLPVALAAAALERKLRHGEFGT